MKRAVVASVTVVIALLAAGCTSGEPDATPEPVAVASETVTPSPSTGVVPNAEYATVEELKDAAVLAGLPCPEWEQSDNVTLAEESGTCSDETVLSIYSGQESLDAQQTVSAEMNQSYYEVVEEIPNPDLVGPNWIIDAPEDDLEVMQPIMGGQIVAFDPDAVEEEPVATTPKKGAHESVSSRELAKIIKSPDKHVGEDVIVYAEVFQFDAATGDDAFLGWLAHKDIESYNSWSSSDGAMFKGDATELEDIVEDDIVKVWGTVEGSFSYDTQGGGNTTVPVFIVNHIDVIGSTE